MAKGEPMEISNQIKTELNSEDSFWWLKFVPQQNTWTNVNIFRFLRLYKTYSVLWDPKNPKYSKSFERSQAYKEISKKLNLQGVSKKECLKLVEALKKIYIEEKQKREEAKSCLQKYKPPPVWFQVLNDIVESVINNENEKSSGNNVNNEIKNDKMKEIINCIKIYTENNWTPNYLKSDFWKLFLPEQKSCATKDGKENIEKHSKTYSKISYNESCGALKPLKKKYCPDYKNSINNIENYCPDFTNILSDSSHSTHSQTIRSEQKYCPEIKNVLCGCSSESVQNEKKYCPQFKNILCDCSSQSSHHEKKYCPEFKNIMCDCLSQSSHNENKYCPEFKNILCDCLSQSCHNENKYCPEFKNILCDCSSDTRYCPKHKDILCNSFSKISSDSKVIEFSDSQISNKKVSTSYTFAMPTFKKVKYNIPYEIELDRFCYYKDWSEYYKCKICDSKENYKEASQSEKNVDKNYNQKPQRHHKNNIAFESEINIFSDINRNYTH